MSVTIADCGEPQLPALQAFFRQVYRPGYALCDEQLLRWQFQHVPGSNDDSFNVKIALLDGNIAGCLGYIPVETSVGGRTCRGAWVVNWMVDPSQRRFGLGPLLMREVVRQFDIVLNAGPNRAARELLARMRWEDAGELTRYVAVLDRAAAASLIEDGELRWPNLQARDVPSASASIVRVDRFADNAGELWDALSRGGLDGTRRSAAYLNWRYAQHPSFQYEMFVQYAGARVTGLAVYRSEVVCGMPVRVARLVEYLEEPIANPRNGSPLLSKILAHARAAGFSVIDFFCADPAIADVFSTHGFVSDRALASQVPVLFQPIDRTRMGIPFMLHLGSSVTGATSRWYVTKSDGDQDRPN